MDLLVSSLRHADEHAVVGSGGFCDKFLLLPQGLGQQGQEPLLLGLAHRTKEFRPAVSGGNLENLLQGGRSVLLDDARKSPAKLVERGKGGRRLNGRYRSPASR